MREFEVGDLVRNPHKDYVRVLAIEGEGLKIQIECEGAFVGEPTEWFKPRDLLLVERDGYGF